MPSTLVPIGSAEALADAERARRGRGRPPHAWSGSSQSCPNLVGVVASPSEHRSGRPRCTGRSTRRQCRRGRMSKAEAMWVLKPRSLAADDARCAGCSCRRRRSGGTGCTWSCRARDGRAEASISGSSSSLPQKRYCIKPRTRWPAACSSQSRLRARRTGSPFCGWRESAPKCTLRDGDHLRGVGEHFHALGHGIHAGSSTKRRAPLTSTKAHTAGADCIDVLEVAKGRNIEFRQI